MKNLAKISCLFAVLVCLIASSSCNKIELSKAELLTDHIWNWNKMTTNSTNENIQNIVLLANALMTGSTLEFRENGTYTITILDTPEDGTWELADNDEILMMDNDELTVIKLTENEFVLEGDEVDEEYGSYKVTLYWKK
jgi:hypothetical protein